MPWFLAVFRGIADAWVRRHGQALGMRRSRRRSAWALIGAALSLGSPLGAACLRLASGESLAHDVSANRVFYVYMTIGTLAAFSSFGWVLGRTADGLAADRRALRVANRSCAACRASTP
jgi:hypothetical protein